jgi:Response regulators consisting of a CheY-like receiver domain and a winged-helix DNA-binding domain
MGRILVVEDNNSYREAIEEALRIAGHQVNGSSNPVSGFEIFAKQKYDLVISDLVMKEFDGIRFLTTIKNIDPTVNTMILTANASDETEKDSIDANIDYYFDKSKSIPVIINYVNALLERKKESHLQAIELESVAEGIIMNLRSHDVIKDGKSIPLTRREFQILKLFLENKYITLSRRDIMDSVWGNPVEEIDERVIDLHIRNLRAKLKIVSLITVRGYGYKWNE